MENQVSKQQVHDVLSGKIKVRFGDSLQAITRYLEASKEASSFPKKSKHFKNQEAKGLEDFAKQNSLWIEKIVALLLIKDNARGASDKR